MTLQEILEKYSRIKENACTSNEWSELDEFIEELAQLASGTVILPGGDLPGDLFYEAIH